MSAAERLNALIMFERAQPATPIVLASAYDIVVAENLRLRDKLLEVAKECTGCEGTGVHTVRGFENRGRAFERQEPCPDCADIREVLE